MESPCAGREWGAALFCQPTKFWCGRSFPPELKMSTLADVLDKPGPENKRCIDPRGAERSDSARA